MLSSNLICKSLIVWEVNLFPNRLMIFVGLILKVNIISYWPLIPILSSYGKCFKNLKGKLLNPPNQWLVSWRCLLWRQLTHHLLPMCKLLFHPSIMLIFTRSRTALIKSIFSHLMMYNALCGTFKDLISHILLLIILKDFNLMMLNKTLVVVNFIPLLTLF